MSNGKPPHRGGNTNPFQTYDKRFTNQGGTPFDTFSASRVSGPQEAAQQQAQSSILPVPIALPAHLYPPPYAQTLDLRRAANVPPGLTTNLIYFKNTLGYFVQFLSYALFTDALLFDSINFVPTVNGVRVYPFHGDPQAQYKIGLGLGTNLNNENLIKALLPLQPNDVLIWAFTNNDTVDVAAGVRMVGYIDQSNVRKNAKFGG